MPVVSVFYPKTSESRFDHDYYRQRHMPLVKARWESLGLEKVELFRGGATLECGPAPFELLGLLTFGTIDQLNHALRTAGQEIIADIPNFTNVTPVIQVNEPVDPF